MLQNYKSNPVAERKSGKKIHFCYNNMNINKIYSLGLRIWSVDYAGHEWMGFGEFHVNLYYSFSHKIFLDYRLLRSLNKVIILCPY